MKVWKAGVLFAVAWTAVCVLFIIWFLRRENQRIRDDACINATVQMQRDILFRDWIAWHGGVYVPRTPATPPNPYLTTPERDVTTISGKQLTLVNPAYMNRQLLEFQKKNPELYSTRLTSLNPLRPENAPEPWERRALEAMQSGSKNFSAVEEIDGKSFLCVMLPLWTQQDCLKCHGSQGYKEGDLRGGMSTKISMAPISEMSAKRKMETWPLLIALWMLGLVGIACRSVALHRTQTELHRAKESAVACERVKSDFLANLSHEVRTPMNGVVGLTDMLMGTVLDERQKKYVRTIQNCGRSLQILLDDVLDIAELDAGAITLHQDEIHLHEMLDELKLMFQPLAESKGLSIATTIQEGIPPSVYEDRVRLRQILVNLVGNALKFTHQGGVGIHILTQKREEHQELIWEIRDTGIGMESSVLDKIFHPFSRAAYQSSRHYEGVGLGLTIAQRLTEKMGGKISVESSVGSGSVFRVVLPLHAIHEKSSVLAAKSATSATTTSLKILVAEDNELNAWVLAQMLRQLGHSVEVASDGEKTLTLWSQGAFDVILMDIRMPGIDGCEAVRRIRETEKKRGCAEGSGVHVIALTAYAMSGDRENFLAAGMDDYLAKPTTLASLEAVLARFIRLRPQTRN